MPIASLPIFLWAHFALAHPLPQIGAANEKHATVSMKGPAGAVGAGGQGSLHIEFKMEEHWHTYPPEPQDYATPTVLTPKFPAGFAALDARWPEPKVEDLFGTPTKVYVGTATVELPFSVAATVAPGKYTLVVDVNYQVCRNTCVDGKETLKAEVEVKGGVAATPAPPPQGPLRGVLVETAPSDVDGEYPMTVEMQISKSTLAPGDEAEITLKFNVEQGWHTYSPRNNPDGGVPMKFTAAGFDLVGEFTGDAPKPVFDKNLDVTNLEYLGEFELRQRVRLAGDLGEKKPSFSVEAQTCNERGCKPPVRWTAEFAIVRLPGRAPDAESGTRTTPTTGKPSQSSTGAGTPSPARPQSTPVKSARDMTLSEFLLWSSVGGWASLFTPCVFPMIPITVSFFSKRSKGSRGKAIGMAGTYAAGIITTFTLIGVLASLTFGATGLTTFATNEWVNLGLGLLFVVLALSLLGLFHFSAPAALTDRVEAAKDTARSDYGLTLLMAVAFTLASFTCTVPVLGGLLALSATGEIGRPIAGMLAYSSTFALPFFVLALFPTTLQKLPRGGAWLEVMKISMGFIEIAAALKFLSNADIALNTQFLTRPVFLAIWVATFLALALYLFGILRMPGSEGEVGPVRALFGVGALALTLYLFAGLFGATYGPFMEGFLPPPNYGGPFLAARSTDRSSANSVAWLDDFDEARRQATATKKRIFINFTGDQ